MTSRPSTRLRRRAEHEYNDDGFTLLEILIVIVVLGLITFGALSMVVAMTSQEYGQQARANAQDDLTNGMRLLARDLQGAQEVIAPPIIEQRSTEVTLLVPDGAGGTEYVHWHFEGTDLVRQQLLDLSFTVVSSQIVVTDIANVASGVPVIEWYDASGVLITDSSPVSAIPCARLATITLEKSVSPTNPPLVLQSSAARRNLDGSTCS